LLYALITSIMRCGPGRDGRDFQATETWSWRLPTSKRGLATHPSTFVILVKSCARKMTQEATWTHNTPTAYPSTRSWRKCVSRLSFRRPANNQDRYKLTVVYISVCELYAQCLTW